MVRRFRVVYEGIKKMTGKELIQAFQMLEKKYPVNQWKIKKVHVWPLIRLCLAAECHNRHFGAKKNTKSSLLTKYQRYLKWLGTYIGTSGMFFFRDYKHNQKIQSSDVVLFGEAVSRAVQMPSGEFFDHILDPIREELTRRGYSVFEFERIAPSYYRGQRWSCSNIVDMQVLKILIKRKLIGNDNTADYEFLAFDEFQSDLVKYKFDVNVLSSIVTHTLLLVDLAEWFEIKLRLIRPSLVLLVSWHGDCQMALTMAAKRLRIPVVDVMHGGSAANGCNYAYSNWTSIPSQGYEIMPNYFWVYSQSDCDAIRLWGKKAVLPILGGRPMNLVWCNPTKGSIALSFRDRCMQFKNGDRPIILLTLAWEVEYPNWLIDFINFDIRYTWLIRFHPHIDDYQRDFVSRLILKDNIFLEKVDFFPLEILLQNVDIHLTMISSVIADAAEWGCCSVAMHPDVLDLYAQQIADRNLFYADGPESLSKIIDEIVKHRKSEGREVNEALYYRYYQGQHGIQRLLDLMKNVKNLAKYD